MNDCEVCIQVEEELEKAKVSLFNDRRAKAILGNEKVEQVELENGQ